MDETRAVAVSRAELCGAWSEPDCLFLWETAQLLPRRSSDHLGDLWVVHGAGACLASGCVYTAARFEAARGELRFSARARARLDGPWRLLWPKARRRAGEPPLLVTARAVRRALDHGYFGSGEWRAPERAYAWLSARVGDGQGVLRRDEVGLTAALREWPLPHGGVVRPGLLQAIERAELAARERRGDGHGALAEAPVHGLARRSP